MVAVRGPATRVNALLVVDPREQQLLLLGGNISANGAVFAPVNDL